MRLNATNHGTSSGFPAASGQSRGNGSARLNLLLSHSGWRDDTFAELLPPLLQPMGVHCVQVRSATEASRVIESQLIHVAVVDVSLPMEDGALGEDPAGPRVLQILRHLDQPPPTVVVRPPQPSAREAVRGLQTMLQEGAFAVIDRPFPVESMLELLRRILHRHYANAWPMRPGA
jgi:CheY-like chemotaxis protein